MKKSAIILAIIVLTVTAAIPVARAQISDREVAVENLTARIEEGSVRVDYLVAVAPRAVGRNHTLLIAPVITDGEFRQSLTAVAVNGPGSKIARRRREVAFGLDPVYEKAVKGRNGERIAVSAVVPFQKWMHGADIVVERVVEGCCSSSRGEDLLAAHVIPPAPQPATATASPSWIPVSVGDSLSTAFRFVLPFSEFDPEEPFRIYDDEMDNGLDIYFPLASHDVRPDYLDNAHTLNNLTGCINMIIASTDSDVAKIVVAGFSSPEGSFEFNDRLAFDRAVSLKKYLMDDTGVTDDTVAIFNGSVDWRGLRARIARSSMAEKNELLEIIDHTPVEGAPGRPGRLEVLKRMNGGDTYLRLQALHFPYLRSGAFIKVFYENK